MPKYKQRPLRRELQSLVNQTATGFTETSAIENLLGDIAKQCGVTPDDLYIVVETEEVPGGEGEGTQEDIVDAYLGCEDPNPDEDGIMDLRDAVSREDTIGFSSGPVKEGNFGFDKEESEEAK